MSDRRGFTIIEVLIAVIILTVGIVGLASTAALVTRMVGQGQRYTEAASMANERFEILRALPCASLTNGSQASQGYTVAWTVTTVGGGDGRRLDVAVTSPTTSGTRQDVFTTMRYCN